MKLTKVASSQSGFTLIELMIVVGIIGILTAIAAPNFARYQSKARQSEAKIALGAVYAAEKSFYAEYSAYCSSMDAIGYAPEGTKRFYKVGFDGTKTNTISGFNSAQITANSFFPRINYPTSWSNCNDSLTAFSPMTIDAAGNPSAPTDDNPQGFLAGATGQVRQNLNCDTWSMDNQKVLKNILVNL